MTKYLQNRIAESGTTLAVSAFYSLIIWLLAGVVVHSWWFQLSCLAIATYLFIELNNSHSIIRIRTRLLSSLFLLFTSAVPVMFSSIRSYILYVCIIISFHLLFRAYQNEKSMRNLFYAFLCIGLASLTTVQILFFVPVLWILCISQLQCLTWRTWSASLMGLIIPYWLLSPFIIYYKGWQLLADHFSALAFTMPLHDFRSFTFNELAFFVFIILLVLISFFHFVKYSFLDRFRIRQIFVIFFTLFVLATILLILQPTHKEVFLPIITICACPIVAHFFVLTNSKITNIMFFVSLAILFLITLIGLIPSLDNMLSELINAPWIGS